MTTHDDRLTPDTETPAQYRDRMARLAEAGEQPYPVDEDDDNDEDDNDEDDGDEGEEDERQENAMAGDAGKSLGELAALRPRTDEDGYAYPPVHLAALPVGEKHVGAAETESLLNGLISECGSLLRDVAFRSACLTPDGGERIRFISAAESLVVTATKVADAIARLRHGEPQVVDAHRHELVYTHVHTTPPSPRSGARGDNQ